MFRRRKKWSSAFLSNQSSTIGSTLCSQNSKTASLLDQSSPTTAGIHGGAGLDLSRLRNSSSSRAKKPRPQRGRGTFLIPYSSYFFSHVWRLAMKLVTISIGLSSTFGSDDLG